MVFPIKMEVRCDCDCAYQELEFEREDEDNIFVRCLGCSHIICVPKPIKLVKDFGTLRWM
jgi:ribosomal protein S27E